MATLEWIAAGLGVVCVALVVLRSVWNFPFAIASVGLYTIVFRDVLLLSDALLQLMFVVTNLYGWAAWLWSRGRTGDVVVEIMAASRRIVWCGAIVIGTAAWGALMMRHTNAQLPFWDAAVAIPSIAAQILLARRKLESWVLWIVVDLVAIPLYSVKGLYPTAGLYVIYLLLSVWGLVDWRARQVRIAGPVPA